MSDFLQWNPTYEHTSVGRPAKINIYLFCGNIDNKKRTLRKRSPIGTDSIKR